MRHHEMLATSLLLVLAACGSSTSESPPPDTASNAGPVRQADAPLDAREALRISARTYISGSVKVKVSGFFDVDGSQNLNKPASITDEDQTWLQYGASGAPELNVLFTNSTAMAEN